MRRERRSAPPWTRSSPDGARSWSAQRLGWSGAHRGRRRGAGGAAVLAAHEAAAAARRDRRRRAERPRRDVRLRRRVLAGRARVPRARRAGDARHAGGGDGVVADPADRARGERVDIDGNGFSAIARLALLQILQRSAKRSACVSSSSGRSNRSRRWRASTSWSARTASTRSCAGRSSTLFSRASSGSRTSSSGTARRKPFECLTLTFRANEHGAFVAHHYRYSPSMSTFIVECDAATWHRAGLDRASDAESRAYCERLFAPDLDGHPLVSNSSIWRNFPLV